MKKKYPAYKPTNIDWIGEIPEHWQTRNLKLISEVNPSNVDKHIFENEIQVKLCNYTDVYYNEFIDGNTYLKNGSCTSLEFEKFELKKGDVIITKDSETPQDIGIPTIIIENLTNTVCGYHLTMIRPRKAILGGFIFRFIQSNGTRRYFEIHSNGITRFGLGKSSIENLKVPLPPLPEQQAIVTYLDQKTALIDELIAKKERKIELLKENRTAIINHAVTKGLDPIAKLKPSGIEWIGEIPEGWILSPLKFYFSKSKDQIKTGPFGSSLKSSDMIENGIKVYNQRSVYDEDFEKGENYVSEEKFNELKGFEVLPNDILITSRGTIGRCTIVPPNIEKGILHPCLIRFRVNESILMKEYIKFYINETSIFIETIKLESNATTIEVIYSDTLKNILIPMPPISEQRKILFHLKTQTNLIDQNINLELQKIEKLKEYRQSLISNVVTGKVCVLAEA